MKGNQCQVVTILALAMMGVARAQPAGSPSPFVSLKVMDTCSQPLEGFQVDNLGLLSTPSNSRGIAEVDRGGQGQVKLAYGRSPVGCEYLDKIDAPQVCVALMVATSGEGGESCLRLREPINVVVAKSDWSRRMLDLVWKRFGSVAGALRLPPCGCRTVAYRRAPPASSEWLIPAGFQLPQVEPRVTAERRYEEGIGLARELRFEEALPLLEEAWRTDPQARYGLDLAVALTEAGELGRAEKTLTEGLRVIELAGDTSEQARTWAKAFHQALAHVLLTGQDWQGAVEQAAAGNDPALRAEALLEKGELSEALDWARRSLDRDETSFEASKCGPDSEPARNVARDHELLGRILRAQGEPEEAVMHFRRAQQLDRCTHPDSPVLGGTSIELAQSLLDSGGRDNLVEARSAAQEGVAALERYFGPNHTRVAEARFVLGSIALAIGSIGLAANSARAALRIDQQAFAPDHARVIQGKSLVERVEVRRKRKVRVRNLTIVGAAVAGVVAGVAVGLSRGSPTPRIEAGQPGPP